MIYFNIRCLKETEEMFSPAVTSLFIASQGKAKSEKVVDQVNQMVEIMQEAFRKNLDNLQWMSPKSREAAEDKLDHMIDLIGTYAIQASYGYLFSIAKIDRLWKIKWNNRAT